MASKQRGGFRPPELRGTLGTLLRTTTGVVRDALERGVREGRARLGDARASSRRQDALADLGELVLELIRRGEIDLTELPEARDLVRQLDELDHEPADEPEPPRASSRHRFDDRAGRDDRATHDAPARGPAPAGDGTVSSGAAARFTRQTIPGLPKHPEPAAPQGPSQLRASGLRPTFDPDTTLAEMPAAKRTLLAQAADPQRKGGISFEDDDLDEYMHPDDVPPKGPPKDPGGSGA